jgi:hypothetical protein
MPSGDALRTDLKVVKDLLEAICEVSPRESGGDVENCIAETRKMVKCLQ